MKVFTFLIPFFLFLSTSCISNSDSPSIFKVNENDANSNNIKKVIPPQAGKLKIAIFSLDNFGDRTKKEGKDTKFSEKEKANFLKETIVDELFFKYDNDIVIVNNITGSFGDRLFDAIVNSSPWSCESNTAANNNSRIYVCIKKDFLTFKYPIDKKNFAVEDLVLTDLETLTKNGFHAIIEIKDTEYIFNLLAVNLLESKSNDLDNKAIRKKQIGSLLSYMNSEKLKESFNSLPTLILGDWQNKESSFQDCYIEKDRIDPANDLKAECELHDHFLELKKSSIPLNIFSSKTSNTIHKDKSKKQVFNHIMYSQIDWKKFGSAVVSGKCTNNYDSEDEYWYRITQSKYCPTSFTLEYLK